MREIAANAHRQGKVSLFVTREKRDYKLKK